MGRDWGGLGKDFGLAGATGQNEVGPADRAQRSAAPLKVVQGVLDFKSKASSNIANIYEAKWSKPRSRLTPSLYLSPGPCTFRRAGLKMTTLSSCWPYFSIFSPSKTLFEKCFEKTWKKCENRGFWPPKPLRKFPRNACKIDVLKNMQSYTNFCSKNLLL